MIPHLIFKMEKDGQTYTIYTWGTEFIKAYNAKGELLEFDPMMEPEDINGAIELFGKIVDVEVLED